MNGKIVRFSRIGVGLLAVLGLALVMSGQEQSPEKHVGLVTDWTSRHIAFSPPSSPLVATQVGQDPRYWQQWARRNMHPVIPESKIDPSAMEGMEGREAESADTENAGGIGPWGFNHEKSGLKKDWSEQMGTTAAMGDLNYPAKYSFSTSTALCSDYAVYNTGEPPNATTGGTAATGSFTIKTDPDGWATGAVTVTVTQGATTQTYTFDSSTTTTANTVLYTSATQGSAATDEDDTADNLEAAIDNNQNDCGYTNGGFSLYTNDCFGTGTATNLLVSATVTGNVVTLTALTVGTGGDTITISTNNDTDIWVNGSSQLTSTLSGGVNPPAQATIIAYTNLYTGTPVGSGGAAPCGLATATPTVAFAYSTGGTVTTSPVISLDGSQIAFVQNTTANAAQLVMIKVSLTSGGTATTPATLNTASSAANYRSGCAVPCMYAITFALDNGTAQGSDGLAGADGSAGSSVWEDYAFDNAYVGDDNGYVHKFSGVFTGSPAEAGSPWPVGITSETSTTNITPLTSPVYDESRGLLYIGDSGGRMDYITVSTGGVTASAQLGSNTHDLYDAPLVDPSSGSNGFLYETVVRTVTTSATCTTGTSCVAQLAGKFASGATPTTVGLGTVASGGKIYTGTFDQIYYAGTNPGHLYMCSGADPKIYELPINPGTGALGTLVTLTTAMTNAAATCSSVTEAYNGTADYIYTSVTIDASVGGNCSGTTRGCVIAYNVTTALAAGATTTLGLYSPGGSSGIIIDNFSGATGASEIYYSPLGGGSGAASCGGSVNAGCAVQAVQGAGL